MSVLKRNDGRWRIDIVIRRGGKSIRIKKAAKGAHNRAEALAMERKLRAELEQKSNPLAKAPLFSDFAKDFLEKYAKANNKPSEYDSKVDILGQHLMPWFGQSRLDEIEDEDVEAYKGAKVDLKLSPKTVNNHLAVLSKLYNVAVDWKRISRGPRIKRLKVPVAEFDFFVLDEFRSLETAGIVLGYPFGHMIRLGLHTGLRLGELLGLRWRDTPYGSQSTGIVVRQSIVRGRKGTPKSHKPREVPLNESARAIFQHIPGGKGDELVFRGDWPLPDSPEGIGTRGRELTKGECKRPLWAACKRVGLRRVGWHVLRHSFASNLAIKGVSIRAIQELLGHSDIRQTMRYAHLCPSVTVDAVKLLDEATNGTTRHTADHQGPIADRSE